MQKDAVARAGDSAGGGHGVPAGLVISIEFFENRWPLYLETGKSEYFDLATPHLST